MYGAVLLLIVVAILVFLVFSIMRVAFKKTNDTVPMQTNESMYDVPYTETPVAQAALVPSPLPKEVKPVEESQTEEVAAPIRENKVAQPMPEVTGQTEEELRAPEPLQERVAQRVDTPSALDTYDNTNNEALFGSNLRHPEAMMARAGPTFASLESEVASGVAGRPEVEKLPFSAEMAQNGGEFMKGIFAFDSSDSGTTFSAY